MKITCNLCEGTGLELPLCATDCDACGGSGQIEKVFKPTFKEPNLPDTEDGQLVQTLCDKLELSDWEIEFCNSVIKWVRNGPLTEKQRSKISEILEK